MKHVVKAQKAYLKSPLTASATSVVLRELVTTKDAAITLANFGDWFTVVVKQGSRIEIIKCDAISTAADGTATLTVATNGRNIDPTSPYAGASTGLSFQSGAEVIVTNDPLAMAQFGNVNKENTWAAVQTFTEIPETAGGDALTANQLIRKAQLDAAVLGIATTINVKVPGTAGETIAAGDLVYFDDTDNEWKKCDADTAATVENTLLGIAQGAGVDGGDILNGVLIRGLDANQTGLTVGAIYYASNTAGQISSAPGTKEVTIGFAYSATQIYFNPRFNQQLTEDQKDALTGTSGNPSAANPYVTQADTTGTGDIVRESLIGELGKGFFGDGSDGTVVWDGAATILGMAPVANVYTLTRDIFVVDGTVDVGVTIKTNGYLIYSNGILTVNGTIHRNGNNGGNGGNGGAASTDAAGSAGTQGSAGAAASGAGTLTAAVAGAAGGAGSGVKNQQGGAGSAGSSLTNSLVSTTYNGKAGGAGGTGGGAAGGANGGGGAAGAVGTATIAAHALYSIHKITSLLTLWDTNGVYTAIPSGSGGGGGGCGYRAVESGAAGGGGGGGGSASPGSLVAIYAKSLVVGATGVISANGGVGGNGGNGGDANYNSGGSTFALGGGGGGGGAGGNGGIVLIISSSITNNGSITATGGAAGTKGTGGVATGTATTKINGADGSDGTAGMGGLVIQFIL